MRIDTVYKLLLHTLTATRKTGCYSTVTKKDRMDLLRRWSRRDRGLQLKFTMQTKHWGWGGHKAKGTVGCFPAGGGERPELGALCFYRVSISELCRPAHPGQEAATPGCFASTLTCPFLKGSSPRSGAPGEAQRSSPARSRWAPRGTVRGQMCGSAPVRQPST